MNPIEFKIFEKKDVPFLIRELNNIIVYSLLGFSSLLWYFSTTFYNGTTFESVCLKLNIFCMLVVLVFGLKVIWTRKPLIEKFNGILRFTENSIDINNNKFIIEDISKIDFGIWDYYDKMGPMIEGDISPAFSNGVDNFINIQLKDGQKIKVHFQIIQKDDFLKMRDLLIHYFCHNKLTFLRLTQLLRISDYDKIQEFKKALPPTAVLRYAG
jgi:hypothetical protein